MENRYRDWLLNPDDGSTAPYSWWYISVHNYYQRLIERGKHPLLIHNNIKNKMLHALVAMVRDRIKYNPDYVYQTNKSVA